MKKLMVAGLLSAMTLAGNASAEVITHGYLVSDTNYNIIADTNLGREYLRFDTFQMSYTQTIASVQAGGIYEGWSIANSTVSDEFINSIFGQTSGNICSVGANVAGESCGTLAGWASNDFGFAYQSSHDYMAFLSQESAPIGLLSVQGGGLVQEYDPWSHISTLDTYPTINLVLYRDNDAHIGGFDVDSAVRAMENPANAVVESSVPVSSSLGLLGLAMLGMRLRRKS